jgi:hypothetical protein
MKWKDKIQQWGEGKIQTYPKNIKSRFFYETFVCDKDLENEYLENFIPNKNLDSLEQNFKSYNNYINESDNKFVTSFNNLNGDARLIIPIPKKGKNFTTIKDFIDNASQTQQKYFWKYAASEIIRILESNDKIFISTHGLGIPYFHLRIDTYPKYYQTKAYIK